MTGHGASRMDLVILGCVRELIAQRHRYRPRSPYRRRIHNELRRGIAHLRRERAFVQYTIDTIGAFSVAKKTATKCARCGSLVNWDLVLKLCRCCGSEESTSVPLE